MWKTIIVMFFAQLQFSWIEPSLGMSSTNELIMERGFPYDAIIGNAVKTFSDGCNKLTFWEERVYYAIAAVWCALTNQRLINKNNDQELLALTKVLIKLGMKESWLLALNPKDAKTCYLGRLGASNKMNIVELDCMQERPEEHYFVTVDNTKTEGTKCPAVNYSQLKQQ